jgi:predicted Zn-dependent peptidase
VNQPDDVAGIIADAAKKAIQSIEQRCSEARKALDQQDYLVSLGAIVGLEDQVRQVAARLLVLREVREIQKQKTT